MTLPELIGFLLAMAALLFSFIRRVLEQRRQALDPEGYQRELEEEQRRQEEAYREMLDSLGIKVEAQPEPPPAPKKKETSQPPSQRRSRRNVTKDFEFHSSLEDRETTSRIEGRTLKTTVGKRFGEGYGKAIVAKDLRGVEVATSRTKGRDTKVQRMMETLPSKRNLLVYREIFGPPRGIEPWDEIRR